jgi:aspartate kinase
MGLIVQKFGGSSVADAERIFLAARRAIKAKLEGNKVVVVVSAMGDTTDDLIALARQISKAPPRREMDMLLSTGEQVSSALMAMAINESGHEAVSLTGAQVGLITDNVHTRARIHRIQADRLQRHLDEDRIVIVAGFQGVDEDFNITTLGRGGSDTTAVALAAVLKADACEIYTDVDGVYTTDPRVVPQARKIDIISYDEMLELAGVGAKVMHSRSIEFAKKYNVVVHVRSSLTDIAGTLIMAEHPGMEDIVVRGAAVRTDLARVLLVGVQNRPGVAADIFARLASRHVVVDDIIQNVFYEHEKSANIGFTIDVDDLDVVKDVCRELVSRYGVQSFEIDDNVAKVSIVGVGMRSHTGVAMKMFRALGEAHVNIENISTSEIVVACIIDRDDADKALQSVHEAFELDKPAEEQTVGKAMAKKPKPKARRAGTRRKKAAK